MLQQSCHGLTKSNNFIVKFKWESEVGVVCVEPLDYCSDAEA